jgi:hypothetical protein
MRFRLEMQNGQVLLTFLSFLEFSLGLPVYCPLFQHLHIVLDYFQIRTHQKYIQVIMWLVNISNMPECFAFRKVRKAFTRNNKNPVGLPLRNFAYTFNTHVIKAMITSVDGVCPARAIL